jgi:hypothetical protein
VGNRLHLVDIERGGLSGMLPWGTSRDRILTANTRDDVDMDVGPRVAENRVVDAIRPDSVTYRQACVSSVSHERDHGRGSEKMELICVGAEGQTGPAQV